MKPPKLTELERLALRCDVYGGIPQAKLKAARQRALKKLGNSIHYRKGGDEVREAYFKWRALHGYETHNVASFVAGFNAARA